MNNQSWYDWIRTHRRRCVMKAALLTVEQAAQLLGWTEEDVMKRGEVEGQRAFWIFVWTDQIRVYPSEVLRLVGREA